MNISVREGYQWPEGGEEGRASTISKEFDDRDYRAKKTNEYLFICYGSVITCTQDGSDCKVVRRGVVDSGEQRLRKVQTGASLSRTGCSTKSLKKIVDVNMILLA